MVKEFKDLIGKKYPGLDGTDPDDIAEVYAGPPFEAEPVDPEEAGEKTETSTETSTTETSTTASDPIPPIGLVYAGPVIMSNAPFMMAAYAGPDPIGMRLGIAAPWNCSRCGKENGPLATSCGYCGNAKTGPFFMMNAQGAEGASEGKRFCRTCGALVPAGQKFCHECGSVVPEDEADTKTEV